MLNLLHIFSFLFLQEENENIIKNLFIFISRSKCYQLLTIIKGVINNYSLKVYQRNVCIEFKGNVDKLLLPEISMAAKGKLKQVSNQLPWFNSDDS